MSIKNRVEKLEQGNVTNGWTPPTLAPTLTPKQWGNAFGGQNIEAEPLTTEQHEWINQYRGVSGEY